MSNQSSAYLNGIYMERKEGQYGEYFTISITDKGLESLKALIPTEKGYRNITASPQKDNNDKFSLKPYVAKSKNGGLPF